MFTTLLESRGTRKTHSRWLPASAVIHVALLAGVVTHSRPAQGREPVVEEPPTITWVATRQPDARSDAAAGATDGASASAPSERPMPVFDNAPVVNLPDVPTSSTGAAVGDNPILSPDARFGVPGGSGLSSGSDGGPRWANQVEKVALPLPGNTVPAYPGVLRSAGIEGSVTVRFVIDTAGAVERGSVVILRTDHELFTAAVRRALSSHRFLPAEAGGVKVRMLVEQRFEFALDAERLSPPRS